VLRDGAPPLADGGFLGVGGPLPATGEAVDLAFARASLTRLGEAFPADRRRILTGAEATPAVLRAQPLEQYRFVHFATHGWADPERPRYHGLRLSPTAGDEGFLQLDQVATLPLASELVVLAACQSGRGEVLEGEGLVGLSWAFLQAGARSLVVSLWDIDDKSTSEFMDAFYAELHAGRTVPDALRRTKLAFLRSSRVAQREPYRWSPFVLVGDPVTAPRPSTPGTVAEVQRAR
jgi:CHAT domain-containing protein